MAGGAGLGRGEDNANDKSAGGAVTSISHERMILKEPPDQATQEALWEAARKAPPVISDLSDKQGKSHTVPCGL